MSVIKFGRKSNVGAAATRKEDERFLKGEGTYPTDCHPDGVLTGFVVRSSYAHARFKINNKADVAAHPGVHLVFTYDDIADLGALLCVTPLGDDDNGKPYQQPPRYMLSKDVVRFVGDPVAFIVADTKECAADAAELFDIDYESLPVATDMERAVEEGAPQVWPGYGARNIAAEIPVGDKMAADAALSRAARVIELKVVNNRLICNYMEPRACTAEYDAADDLTTLTLGSQGVHSIQNKLAQTILNIDKERIRVITPDVGGGFGTKNFMYHEYPLCAVAAKRLNQPVQWVGDRTEHFVADVHGRDNITTAWLGLDADNRFVALKVDILANMGGYLSDLSTIIPWFAAIMATGVYDIPVLYAHVRCVFTHTAPTDAYRGAGRPEAAYLIERLVNYTALEMGMDANELRRLNFIKPDQFPYRTAAGRNIDVGEFDGHMTRALDVAGWDNFEGRAAESKKAGKMRGIGLATYIEACAFAGSEPAKIELNDDGSVTLVIGTQSTGQGHATAYAQFISAHLNLGLDQIHMHQGDTSRLSAGGGTGGSRSIPIGGVSVDRASIDLAMKIKQLASDKLEVSAGDLELVDGTVTIVGTDQSLSFAEVASLSDDHVTGTGEIVQDEATYPNGTHVCELEVDPETGVVNILDYTVVDDFGVTVNPLLLAGQVHGGIVQGIGQALYERTIYDENGQLLTASFMDYTMPRADHFPDIHFETRNVPSRTNALGIKGAGEAGSIGSSPAVMNALVDALHRGCDITHIDMPALPQTIWAAIQEAK